MLYAFGANLMMTCYGIVFSASGFMIPQLEDPFTGFGITKEQGSWLASIMVTKHFLKYPPIFPNIDRERDPKVKMYTKIGHTFTR